MYRVAKKHNSQALEADALHFSTDIRSSAVVLSGLICANFGFFFADSVAALMVALIVLFVSYKPGKRAVDVLMDTGPRETILKVRHVLTTYPEIKQNHGLKIRTSGADSFIKVNIHVDPDSGLKNVHVLCDKIERELQQLIPRSEVYIHAEPKDFPHLKKDEKDNDLSN